MQTFTDFLKEQFIGEGRVTKENFQELYYEWYSELEDKELDKFANQWKRETGLTLNN